MAYIRSRAKTGIRFVEDGTWNYRRVSTRRQARDGHSLESQERTEAETMRREGWHAMAEYVDAGASAFRGYCPEMMRLLSDLARARVRPARILLPTLDRAARNLGYQSWMFHEMLELGVRPYFVDNPTLDVSTADGMLIANFVGSQSQWFSQKLRERMRTATRHSRLAGRWPGQPPCGYLPDPLRPGIPRPDPDQAPLMAEYMERFANGGNATAVWRDLQSRGFRPSRTRALQLLANPIYCGRTLPVDGVSVTGLWQPLVPVALWERVQRRLEGRQDDSVRAYGRHDELFPLARGFARCAVCGEALVMDASVRGKRPALRPYYTRKVKVCSGCPRNVRPETLHEMFRTLLRRVIVSAAFSREEVERQWRREDEERREQRQRLQAALNRLEGEREKAVKGFLVARTDAMRSALEAEISGVEGRAAATAEEIRHLESELEISDAEVNSLLELVRGLDLEAEWVSRSLADRRAMQGFVFPLGISVYRDAEKRLEMRTPVTASIFSLLPAGESESERVASPGATAPAGITLVRLFRAA